MSPKKIFLTLLLLTAFIFRFYNLSGVPPSPTVDEVSIGYNAFSILKTGADEYGEKFPLLLRAYDDWRPALYVYLVVPFISVFDLSVFSIRFPSALLSALSVLAFYLLVKEIFKNSIQNFKILTLNIGIAEVSSMFLAISPWHIYLSRLGHEVNAYLSFLIFGIYFFIRFLNGKAWNLIASSIFLALSFTAYQSGKIVVPVITLVMFVLFFKKIIKEKPHFLISLILGIMIILPTIFASFGENSLIRYKATSIFQNSPDYFEQSSRKYSSDVENGNYGGILLNNRKVVSLMLVSKAYLSHFDPIWLSFNKGYESFKAPSSSLLFLFQLPLILLGVFFLLRNQSEKKYFWLIIFIGLASVLPASITTGYPHAMRAVGLVISFQILSAAGFVSLIEFIRNKKIRLGFITISFLILISSVILFCRSYFFLLPRDLAYHFQYGPLVALSEAKRLGESYEKIVVSNKNRLFESYMFYLYLEKYDPKRYQNSGGTVSGGFSEEHKIGKYYFGEIKPEAGNYLYIINPEELSQDMNILKDIKYPNGETALLLVKLR